MFAALAILSFWPESALGSVLAEIRGSWAWSETIRAPNGARVVVRGKLEIRSFDKNGFMVTANFKGKWKKTNFWSKSVAEFYRNGTSRTVTTSNDEPKTVERGTWRVKGRVIELKASGGERSTLSLRNRKTLLARTVEADGTVSRVTLRRVRS